MSTDEMTFINIRPLVNIPRRAKSDHTYLMSVDLRHDIPPEEWPYEREEFALTCLLDTLPLFEHQPLGEPSLILHRFGGTYGEIRFLLKACPEEIEGRVLITLINESGLPVHSIELSDIQVSYHGHREQPELPVKVPGYARSPVPEPVPVEEPAQESYAAVEEKGFANIDWPAILLHLKKQNLVPFLGAGASLVSNGTAGLSGGSKLAESLAEECNYPGMDTDDLLRVSQYYALTIGEMPLRESVNEKLSLPDVKPGEVHNILAGWPIEVVLTTNFDNLMERAFIMNGKDASKAIYNRLGDQEQIKIAPTVHAPLVYKLHGSFEDIDSMIMTQDNYIDFLISLIEGNPKIPDRIKNIFNTCSILFIGCNLEDWNLRFLLRYLRRTDQRSFAILQHLASTSDEGKMREWEGMALYWEDKKISVYNCDAIGFLRELDRRYKRESSN